MVPTIVATNLVWLIWKLQFYFTRTNSQDWCMNRFHHSLPVKTLNYFLFISSTRFELWTHNYVFLLFKGCEKFTGSFPSITPSLHHSIIPSLQYSSTSLFVFILCHFRHSEFLYLAAAGHGVFGYEFIILGIFFHRHFIIFFHQKSAGAQLALLIIPLVRVAHWVFWNSGLSIKAISMVQLSISFITLTRWLTAE